jgi:hypothetical protein
MTRTTPISGAARLRRALLVAAACAAHPAFAETSLRPYVELRAVADGNDLLELGNYRTWLETAAGLAADFDSQRVDGSLNYRIARRYPLGDARLNDKVRHRGSGSVRAELLRDYVFLNATGSASIVSPSFGGFINPDSDDPTDQQAFGATISPSFRHNFGNRILVTANYRYGLFEVEGGIPPVEIGQPFSFTRSYFGGASDQRSQSASASIGNSRRSDRIRWRIEGDWQRDRIEQLDEHYNAKSVVGDLEVGVTRFLSVLGSGGYEDIYNELDSVFLNPLTGLPILDANGLVQRDPANPRRVNFDFEGPRWDVGVRLTPSRRTGLVVRAGRRFGSFSGSGSVYYQARSDLTFSGAYRDAINNFGRLYTGLFADPISGRIIPVGTRGASGSRRGGIPLGAGTCAFGFNPETQFCRFNITQIATSAVFRERTANLTVQKGDPEFADDRRFYGYATAFYTRRKYLGESDLVPPVQVPFVPALYLAGTTDTSYGLNLHGERLLGSNRYVTLDIQTQRNRYALASDSKDVQIAGYAQYEMLLDRQINAFATAFLSRRFADRSDSGSPFFSRIGQRDRTQATFSVGVRYLFAPFRGRFTPTTNENSRQ